ncbi:hypothetical protein [Streptomyces sp. A0592]|uniref:hypothetical protein n=1 Tax=Streptomyces sp. A0592 TaxID=2563099 RepID=UPI00113D1E27|nr:hypothetical protein [Streptomyces sp. A0592]THA77285.1 hypothetical protein E6U81_34360 [Streptomyces sp. A0592]
MNAFKASSRILGAAMPVMSVAARERVHPWQFGLAVCAAVTPLPPVLASGEGLFALPLVVATTAVLAVPLFLHARRSAFERAARVVAAVLVPWSLIGAWFGMFVYLPSALLLLLASLADPRRRPTAAVAAAGAGLLLAAAVVLSC